MAKSLRSPRQQKLIEALKAARKSAGLTQAAVAAALEKPQSYIAKAESGERRLDLIELLDLAQIIGIDMPRLIYMLQPPEAPKRKKVHFRLRTK